MATQRTSDSHYRNRRKALIRVTKACYLCGDAIDPTLKRPHPMAPEADHVLAVNKGGDNRYGELKIVHALCNKRKGDRSVEEAGLAIKKTSGLWSEMLNEAALEGDE